MPEKSEMFISSSLVLLCLSNKEKLTRFEVAANTLMTFAGEFCTKEIAPLHKWHLNLNNNALYILTPCIHVSRQRNFHMNVRLRMYEYCHSNLGAIYAKGL